LAKSINERESRSIIDAVCFDVGDQALQRRSLQGAAGEAPVVITVGNEQPALGLLARNIGLAGLALGVEAVKLHVEAFLARFAGVDRAAELSDHRPFHKRPR
jgi:hypothetical protein